MKIGIVGAERAKFTPLGERQAKLTIREILTAPGVTEVVSGHSHLGGIDIWAEDIGKELGLRVTVFPPAVLSWEGGYKQRNLAIATHSDVVHCIAVDKLPRDFTGMRFEKCYHCHREDHVKSGGCWTMSKARVGVLHIVQNYQRSEEP